jgi:hypothetical protein
MILIKELRIFDRKLLFKFQSMKIPKEPTAGISARVKNTTEYVIFLDYDNITDERLIEESRYLQELFGVGDFIILATNEFGRHVICIDRLFLKKAIEVVQSSTCDGIFQKGIRYNEHRTWILRAIEKGNRPKPQYLYTVESPYNGKRLQSQAHGEFLQRHYNANVRLVNPDGNEELEIEGYKTSNKTSLKDVKQ